MISVQEREVQVVKVISEKNLNDIDLRKPLILLDCAGRVGHI
jgi:hypothetical protein